MQNEINKVINCLNYEEEDEDEEYEEEEEEEEIEWGKEETVLFLLARNFWYSCLS